MKKTILTLLLIIPNFIYSNGGPVDMSHFRKTGNIRLMTKKEVLLKKEDLKIKIIGDYTEIDVKYELQNLGKKQKIQYGFPVDAFETDWYYGDPYEVFSSNNDCVQYFEAYANNQQLKVSQWIVDSVYNAFPVNLNEGINHRTEKKYQIVRKWSAITLAFEQNEVKTVRIKYKIKNTLRDKIPGFKFIDRYTDRNFSYDLNPSRNWGNGVVEEFKIELDLRNLGATRSQYRLEAMDLLEVEKDHYTQTIVNYNLHEAGRINIKYNNRHEKMSKFIEESEISEKSIKSITSSSNNQPVENLIDGLNETTWSGKKGDWIEIEINKTAIGGKSIKGILALNGDYSTEINHKENGQLKSVKVILNNIAFNTEPWEGENGSKIIQLPQNEYTTVKEDDIKGLATIIADGNGFSTKTHKIRIEILATHGEKATLSELFFVGR